MQTVTTDADSGAGSLRAAVATANGTPARDTINFASNVTGTITLTSGELTVSQPLTVAGPGAEILAVSGNDSSRILHVTAGVDVDVAGLELTHGRVDAVDGGEGSGTGGDGSDGRRRGGPPQAFGGGAIFNQGSLTLDDVVVSDSNAVAGFGGIGTGTGGNGGNGGATEGGDAGSGGGAGGGAGDVAGGGINNASGATLALIDTEVTGNRALAGAGGIATAVGGTGGDGGSGASSDGGDGGNGTAGTGAGGDASGGGIYSAGILSIERSAVVENEVVAGDSGDAFATGGDGGDGGPVGNGGKGGNAAAIAGDGGSAIGGGIHSVGSMTAANSTLAENIAEPGAVGSVIADGGEGGSPAEGGGNGGAGGSASAITGDPGTARAGGIETSGATLGSLTVAGNSAPDTANLRVSGGVVDVRNSIVADPQGDQSCDGTLGSGGFNLDEDSSCGLAALTDLSGLDPGLEALGGSVPRILALSLDSPALDSGDSGSLDVDQRGFPRPVDLVGTGNGAGDESDIGAYELKGKGCNGLRTLFTVSSGVPAIGTQGGDVIVGTSGDDEINGGSGDDVVCSRAGDDMVRGQANDDTLDGGRGADTLSGSSGKDDLIGGPGRDDLEGGPGADLLDGGTGDDKCIGGAGDTLISC